jgi:hypothetical protein
MQTKREDILNRLRAAKPALENTFPIQRLALFGSWSRGDQAESSDVDILVEVDPTIGLGFVTLAEQLEATLGLKVDLVSRRAIKPSLWKIIEAELIDV